MDPTSTPPVVQPVTIPAENSTILASTPINKKWTKVIPSINILFLVLSSLLLFGLDLLILLTASDSGMLSRDALFNIWIFMLAAFAGFIGFFVLENFWLKNKLSLSKSRLDNWIILLIVVRNLAVLGSSMPLIHLFVWAFGMYLVIPFMMLYMLVILKRFKVV